MCVCERETSSAFVITLTQVQVQSTKLCVCLVHGKKVPCFAVLCLLAVAGSVVICRRPDVIVKSRH